MPDHLRNRGAYYCRIFDLMIGDPYEIIIEALEVNTRHDFIKAWLSCKKITRDDLNRANSWVRKNEPNGRPAKILRDIINQ